MGILRMFNEKKTKIEIVFFFLFEDQKRTGGSGLGISDF